MPIALNRKFVMACGGISITLGYSQAHTKVFNDAIAKETMPVWAD